MAFTEFERAANHAALKWLLARHSPPEHIRDQLDIGYAVVGHTVDILEIRPLWDDKSVTRLRLSRVQSSSAHAGSGVFTGEEPT
jgi:hypothetical protein